MRLVVCGLGHGPKHRAIDGGAVAHEHVVAETAIEPTAAVVAAAELVDGLEVGDACLQAGLPNGCYRADKRPA